MTLPLVAPNWTVPLVLPLLEKLLRQHAQQCMLGHTRGVAGGGTNGGGGSGSRASTAAVALW